MNHTYTHNEQLKIHKIELLSNTQESMTKNPRDNISQTGE